MPHLAAGSSSLTQAASVASQIMADNKNKVGQRHQGIIASSHDVSRRQRCQGGCGSRRQMKGGCHHSSSEDCQSSHHQARNRHSHCCCRALSEAASARRQSIGTATACVRG